MSHRPKDKIARQKKAQETLFKTEKLLKSKTILPAKEIDVIDELILNDHLGFDFKKDIEFKEGYTQDISINCKFDEIFGVLIFGSARKPGGGWLNGAKAQEEDVSLYSTWGEQARLGGVDFYKNDGEKYGGVGPDKILQANGMWLRNQYGVIDNDNKKVSFISIAAPNLSSEKVKDIKCDARIDILARRIATALEYWHKQKVEKVILGAIGCGVFKWDGKDSAKSFKTAINHHLNKYKSIPKIMFVMSDDKLMKIFKEVILSSNLDVRPQTKHKRKIKN